VGACQAIAKAFYFEFMRIKLLFINLLLALGLLAARATSAQTPDWHAAQTLPGYRASCCFRESAVDAAGNVYLTGSFSGDATFGDTTLRWSSKSRQNWVL
jgi:hypothetical protein